MHKTFAEYVAQREGTPIEEGWRDVIGLGEKPFEKLVKSTGEFKWLAQEYKKIGEAKLLSMLRQSFAEQIGQGEDLDAIAEKSPVWIKDHLPGNIKILTRGREAPEEPTSGSAASPIGGRDAHRARVDAVMGGNRFAK